MVSTDALRSVVILTMISAVTATGFGFSIWMVISGFSSQIQSSVTGTLDLRSSRLAGSVTVGLSPPGFVALQLQAIAAMEAMIVSI